MGLGGIGRGPILADAHARGRLSKRKASMPDTTLEVTYEPEDTSRIPDILREGVGLLMLLRGALLDQVAERMHIRCQGGYAGLDL